MNAMAEADATYWKEMHRAANARADRAEARITSIVELAQARWPEVATLESAWDRMASDRNAAEADARRYRWLRSDDVQEPEYSVFRCAGNFYPTGEAALVEGALDAAIDAALAKVEGGDISTEEKGNE